MRARPQARPGASARPSFPGQAAAGARRMPGMRLLNSSVTLKTISWSQAPARPDLGKPQLRFVRRRSVSSLSSRVTCSVVCLTLCDSMGCSPQAPLSVEFSRQEYRSGWPSPSPGDLPDPGIEPTSPTLQADSLQR